MPSDLYLQHRGADQVGPFKEYSAAGEIVERQGVVLLSAGSAASMTITAPTVGLDDAKVLKIIAIAAQAYTVTFATTGFNAAGGSGDVATFGGAKGDSMEIVAYQGNWYTTILRNVTLG